MPREEDLGDQEKRLLDLFMRIQIRKSHESSPDKRFILIERKIDAGNATVYEIADWFEFWYKDDPFAWKATALLREQFSNLRGDYAEYLAESRKDRALDEIRAALDILEG